VALGFIKATETLQEKPPSTLKQPLKNNSKKAPIPIKILVIFENPPH
jgi:hypothetical protein